MQESDVKGCVIIGYQGIGKSTLARRSNKYIDLESSCFFIDGVRSEDWYIPYSNVAIDIASQGYRVFTSSHECVRKQLISSLPLKHRKDVRLFVCFPCHNLKGAWIEKLQYRYEETKLEKDMKAWLNAKDRFDDNIREISNTFPAGRIILWDIDYDLEYEIDSMFSR